MFLLRTLPIKIWSAYFTSSESFILRHSHAYEAVVVITVKIIRIVCFIAYNLLIYVIRCNNKEILLSIYSFRLGFLSASKFVLKEKQKSQLFLRLLLTVTFTK